MATISDTLLTIDDIISDLRDRSKISPSQAKLILELEYNASRSERSADAKINVSKMQPFDPERIFVETVLIQTEKALLEHASQAKSLANPELRVITGAPGSGKSTLSKKICAQNSDSIYLCGDLVKATFIRLLNDGAAFHNIGDQLLEKYRDAVYIHRFTSHITWKLLSECINKQRSIVLEMIGADAHADASTISEAFKRGYEVELHHVACHQGKAIESAVDRYFTTGAIDSGRYISLVNIANKQSKILECFRETVSYLHNISCKVTMYDNSEWKMLEIYRRNSAADDLPEISNFQMPPRDRALWYTGKNPSSDVAAFAYDEDGELAVLTYRRFSYPYTEHQCLPGGFLYTSSAKGSPFIQDMESPIEAAYREFKQRTYWDLGEKHNLLPIGVYSKADRDPRNSSLAWVESHAFAFYSDMAIKLVEYEYSCEWTKVNCIINEPFVAFDHREIILDAVKSLGLPLTKPT